MCLIIATAYKNGLITCSVKHKVNAGYDELTAADIHHMLNHNEAVMLQLPKDINIKLTNAGDEVLARIIDCTNDQPIITVHRGKLGKREQFTGTPMAWTEQGKILIIQLLTDHIN